MATVLELVRGRRAFRERGPNTKFGRALRRLGHEVGQKRLVGAFETKAERPQR